MLIERGRALSRLGRFDEAIADFERAIGLNKRISLAFVERGYALQNLGRLREAAASYGEAVKLDPDDREALIRRAFVWNQLGELDREIDDLGRLIKLDPTSPEYRAMRGVAYILRGSSDKGIQDIRKAIQLNPGDVGATFQPTTSKNLSPEALEHGEEQVRRMLRDRPAMAEHVEAGDALWTWAVRKFAGEDLGSLVDWDPTLPRPQLGYSWGPNNGKNARIQVARDDEARPLSFERLWSIATFELYNLIAAHERDEFISDAEHGKMARDDYILGMIKSEEQTMQRTRALFVDFFLVWLQSHSLNNIHPRNWFCDAFEEIGESADAERFWRSSPHWHLYGAQYDLISAEREFRFGHYEIARSLAQSVLADAPNLQPGRVAEAHRLLGNIEAAMNNPRGAIDE